MIRIKHIIIAAVLFAFCLNPILAENWYCHFQKTSNHRIKKSILKYYINKESDITKKDAIWIEIYKSPIESAGYSFYVFHTPTSSVHDFYEVYIKHKKEGQIYLSFEFDKIVKKILEVIQIENSEKAITLLNYYLDLPQFKQQKSSSDILFGTSSVNTHKLNDSVSVITPIRSKVQPFFPIHGDQQDLNEFPISCIADTANIEKFQMQIYGQKAEAKLYVLYRDSLGVDRLSILESEFDGKYAYSFVSNYNGTRIYEMESSLRKSQHSQTINKTIIYNWLIRECVCAPNYISNAEKYRIIEKINNIVDSFNKD